MMDAIPANLTFDKRRNVIIAAGVRVANDMGLTYVTWRRVSAACSVPTAVGTARFYFRNHDALWRAIAEHPDASDTVRHVAKELGLIHDIAS